MTCGSVWACPICSARIWAERGDELQRAVDAHHAAGGRVVMATLTMRHERRQKLSELWDALGDAWTATRGGYRSARQALESVGCRGWARVVEATHGANGWHLHVHALLFISGPVSHDELAGLGDALYGAWSKSLRRRSGLQPTRQHGVDVLLVDVDGVAEIAGYVAKSVYSEAASAALEVTGQHTKRARGENRTPWGVLNGLATLGLARDAAIWREWEQASKGRRALTWSQGLRDELLSEPERTDDEIAADGDAEKIDVALIPTSAWRAVCRIRHGRARLLDAAETGSPADAFHALDGVLFALTGEHAQRPPPREENEP